LARLARSFPDTKFLRAKASALGFATTRSSSSKSHNFGTPLNSLQEEDDDDDLDEKDEYDDRNGDEFDSDDVDLDMLPTMLVYLNGELVHNWVRVDWEAGQAGIQELLDKLSSSLFFIFYPKFSWRFFRHHILPHTSSSHQDHDNLGLPSDDEDFDLMWSDDDDIKHEL